MLLLPARRGGVVKVPMYCTSSPRTMETCEIPIPRCRRLHSGFATLLAFRPRAITLLTEGPFSIPLQTFCGFGPLRRLARGWGEREGAWCRKRERERAAYCARPPPAAVASPARLPSP